jgi:hypothetical protein
MYSTTKLQWMPSRKPSAKRGERTETDADDDYERYGLYFPDSIGYIIRADGSRKLLYYGEIKIVKATGEYHVIPRTDPRRQSK